MQTNFIPKNCLWGKYFFADSYNYKHNDGAWNFQITKKDKISHILNVYIKSRDINQSEHNFYVEKEELVVLLNQKMLLIIFLVVFCSSRTILSQSMSVYGCRELRNVTFLGYFSNLFPPLEEHNPCINYHIYDPYKKKVVPANREEMERISMLPLFYSDFNMHMFYAVQLILDEGNSASNDYRQTLLYANPFNRSQSRLTFEHLKQLQNERGWDIIIVCDLSLTGKFQCPTMSWIPLNRLFPNRIDRYHFEKYFSTLIKNPKFDVVQWHRTITPDNDDNSCIIKQDTVVNIVSH